ncbi:hypothetical protein [Paenibacillus sp. Leaf72]|uniref:hypothetical protein n=1 Tax=Paenibacillus sp. Leaf72 TaxID=1736234 RepID=UPI0006FBCE75|nr:hypothetical protein [Paenibacillus sp. Leaf72]KQN96976.1 hypothetical protein ASF12_23190 [Paenibacillus sp. Leaf72]
MNTTIQQDLEQIYYIPVIILVFLFILIIVVEAYQRHFRKVKNDKEKTTYTFRKNFAFWMAFIPIATIYSSIISLLIYLIIMAFINYLVITLWVLVAIIALTWLVYALDYFDLF